MIAPLDEKEDSSSSLQSVHVALTLRSGYGKMLHVESIEAMLHPMQANPAHAAQ